MASGRDATRADAKNLAVHIGEYSVRVHDYLDLQAEQRPNAEFAICSDERITYREAQQLANRVSRALIGSGAKPGDRVAILQRKQY